MENKNEIKKYFYNGQDYEFRLSRGAKVELEKEQGKQISKLSEIDPEVADVLMSGLNDENISEIPEKEQAALLLKAGSAIQKLEELDNGLDVYDVGYILLKNNLKYKEEMKRDFFDEMVFNMEETKGFTETFRFFEEIRDNVFTILEGLKVKETQEKKRKTNVKKNIS